MWGAFATRGFGSRSDGINAYGSVRGGDVGDEAEVEPADPLLEDVADVSLAKTSVARAPDDAVLEEQDDDLESKESAAWNPGILSGLPPALVDDIVSEQNSSPPQEEVHSVVEEAGETPSEARYRSDIQGLLTLKSNRPNEQDILARSSQSHAESLYMRVRDQDPLQGAA